MCPFSTKPFNYNVIEFKSQGEPPDVMNLSDIATVEVSK